MNETQLQQLTHYVQLLGVPAQRSLRSGFKEGIRVSVEHDVDPVAIERGGQLFAQARCTACHVAEIKTGSNHPFQEVREQTIRPYTDLLLHDMGPGLADATGYTEGRAQPQMWRTSPLWGIGSLQYVQETPDQYNGPQIKHGPMSNARYLHDGRARTLMEAILWHDGEAATSRRTFEGMSKADRDAILSFLYSL